MPESREPRLLSAGELAKRLKLDPSRVRRLAESGALPARKIAHRWLFDASLIDRQLKRRRERGRPFSAENALGLLFMASGEDAPWLRPHARSRLKRHLRSSLLNLLPRLERRAAVRSFSAPEALRDKLSRDPKFILSGVSASDHYAMRMVSPGILEGYYPKREMSEIEHRYALENVGEHEANLVVHVLDHELAIGSRRFMPKAVAAADLAESADERTRRVGEQFLSSVTR